MMHDPLSKDVYLAVLPKEIHALQNHLMSENSSFHIKKVFHWEIYNILCCLPCSDCINRNVYFYVVENMKLSTITLKVKFFHINLTIVNTNININ